MAAIEQAVERGLTDGFAFCPRRAIDETRKPRQFIYGLGAEPLGKFPDFRRGLIRGAFRPARALSLAALHWL